MLYVYEGDGWFMCMREMDAYVHIYSMYSEDMGQSE